MATDIRLKEGLPDVTEALVATYAECKYINHLGHKPLPSREAIVEILTDLMDILYPGFWRRQNLHIGNVEYHVGDVIDGLHDKLTTQIARVLRHDSDQADAGIDFERLAQQKTIDFLKQLPSLRTVLQQDVEAAYVGDPAAKSCHEIIFCYPGLEAVTIYRLAHELLLLGVPLIPRMMTEFAHSKTGIDIHPGARIGPSFFIDHGTGVVIGETCDIGRHVKLYQGVTLGAPQFSTGCRRQHHPRHETSPHAFGRSSGLCQCHHPRRRHCHRPSCGGRIERVANPQRGSLHGRHAGETLAQNQRAGHEGPWSRVSDLIKRHKARCAAPDRHAVWLAPATNTVNPG